MGGQSAQWTDCAGRAEAGQETAEEGAGESYRRAEGQEGLRGQVAALPFFLPHPSPLQSTSHTLPTVLLAERRTAQRPGSSKRFRPYSGQTALSKWSEISASSARRRPMAAR